MPHWIIQPWPHNLSKTASGKPGAVHCGTGKFEVLPKRVRRSPRIVKRSIAWLNRNAIAFLRWASVRLMLRRLCRS
jgi:hypothetical protein